VGQEISRTHFNEQDFATFEARLAAETALLRSQCRQGALTDGDYRIGFEVEAWLIDHTGFPAPGNSEYLAVLGNPLVVPELSRFNIEVNGTPQSLSGMAFRNLENELAATWRHCLDVAQTMNLDLGLIGILPTVRESDLTMANISRLHRYEALNEQILKRRGGRPIVIDIQGVERLQTVHDDVMLEAAATSFQVHLQVPTREILRHYNSSLIASAPVLALGVNSPFLFSHRLWQETRIPLFEQAVAILPANADPASRRVSFGSGYLAESIDEYFTDCAARYPVLLPYASDTPTDEFAHLRLHNGTIWRWNRPLVGFDHNGRPHLRIEHRVLPAGPTLIDMFANAAFYTGLVTYLAHQSRPPEFDFPFEKARANFYNAARHGLDAVLFWPGSDATTARELVLERLIPMARDGLGRHGIATSDIDRYCGVLDARARNGQTGACWQQRWADRFGRDPRQLSNAYLANQRRGLPVHEWVL